MKRVVVITVALAVLGLMLAAIPPPAESVPFTSAQEFNPPRSALDSVGAIALFAIPTPATELAATTLLATAAGRSYLAMPSFAGDDDEGRSGAHADASAPTFSPAGRRLVDTAEQYTGVRYRWAGMSSRGMDCSGLIARVLKANGIRAPRRAAELFKLGRPVRFNDLQPGDLMFFKTSRRGISHVGMYVGDDKFIHASSGAGRVVTTSVFDPYYSARLKGARRLGPAPAPEPESEPDPDPDAPRR